ncbi:MAG: hypothetical protein FJX72_13305, partial [Armatimonadetes bacterium]|nr:hypothetical protein [Armatimonadota bacterium]
MTQPTEPVSSDPAPETSAPSARAAALGALWPALAYIAFWQMAPRVRDERMGTVLVSTMVSLFLVVVVAASIGRAA